ncbi:MAG: sulfatase-like hydrolase/transferase [Gemmatimonadetes bacterium]|nr:sulfatase-like hydrolase/transferase [Gemmatimonadota bacterium]
MRVRTCLPFVACLLLSTVSASHLSAQQNQRPNIVLMFPDNLGWGEVGAYGSVRDVPTPNIDRIGAEGMRLNNFNVEYSCTVSRAALLTGRYAIRTGAAQPTGITLWEVTLAEALKSAGYSTGIFGKWHLGGNEWLGRTPGHQGFDEWWGIPHTSNASMVTTSPTFDPATTEVPYIWEQKAGEAPKKLKVFDLESRPFVDREAAEHGIQFMERSVREQKPFFFYYPITQIHFPTLAHPDFAGKSGAGDIGDAMADIDHNVGLVLDAIKRLGIERNTLVFWCTGTTALRSGARGEERPARGAATTTPSWRAGFAHRASSGGPAGFRPGRCRTKSSTRLISCRLSRPPLAPTSYPRIARLTV